MTSCNMARQSVPFSCRLQAAPPWRKCALCTLVEPQTRWMESPSIHSYFPSFSYFSCTAASSLPCSPSLFCAVARPLTVFEILFLASLVSYSQHTTELHPRRRPDPDSPTPRPAPRPRRRRPATALPTLPTAEQRKTPSRAYTSRAEGGRGLKVPALSCRGLLLSKLVSRTGREKTTHQRYLSVPVVERT